jgi:hypothetical protein
MAKPVMTGDWRGEINGLRYRLEVLQIASHVSGLLHVGGFKKTGNIGGVNYYPVVVLSGSFLRQGAHFEGRFVDDNTITGTLKFQLDRVTVTFHRDLAAKPAKP